MMGQLDELVDVISGEFKPSEVANTLWSYETIERKPRERMMGQMQRRVPLFIVDSVYCRFCCPVGI
jgi:hypothetical protein